MTDPLGPGDRIMRGTLLAIQRMMAIVAEADPSGWYTSVLWKDITTEPGSNL
jgi:hypothetical protein